MMAGTRGERGWHIRDRSWRLRCSLLLKARLQNWHLYLRSGASEAFREDAVEAAGGGRTATLAPGISTKSSRVSVGGWRQRTTAKLRSEIGQLGWARQHDG